MNEESFDTISEVKAAFEQLRYIVAVSSEDYGEQSGVLHNIDAVEDDIMAILRGRLYASGGMAYRSEPAPNFVAEGD